MLPYSLHIAVPNDKFRSLFVEYASFGGNGEYILFYLNV